MSTESPRRRAPGRRSPPSVPPRPTLPDEGAADAVQYVARFGRMLQARAGEQAERRRIRVVGPGEVEEAWDDLMRPARRPGFWQVLLQELCVLLAGGLLSAAGGVLWFVEAGGTGFAISLAIAGVMSGLAAATLRTQF